MFRAVAASFALYFAFACAVCAQEMRSTARQFGLIGKVQSTETVLVNTSTRSYKLLPGGRELLDDFGDPSAGTPAKPLLLELLKFNPGSTLTEDVDLDRPSIEQESYRYEYSYDQNGRLVEKRGYKENGQFDERIAYAYGPGGKKAEQFLYSKAGGISGRYKFDEHESIVSVEWYNEDGSVRRREDHKYEYFDRGNVLEQMYYPPKPPEGAGLHLVSAPPARRDGVATTTDPQGFRTVYLHDEAGRVREESRFLPDGSLHEQKFFDENGVLRKSEWRVGDLTATTTLYNEKGKETESHTLAKQGLGSPRAVDDRTVFCYDEHGNLTEMATRARDGSLIRLTTNAYEYDAKGNWIRKTETLLDNIWKTEPFRAVFETVRESRRTISYFPDN